MKKSKDKNGFWKVSAVTADANAENIAESTVRVIHRHEQRAGKDLSTFGKYAIGGMFNALCQAQTAYKAIGKTHKAIQEDSVIKSRPVDSSGNEAQPATA